MTRTTTTTSDYHFKKLSPRPQSEAVGIGDAAGIDRIDLQVVPLNHHRRPLYRVRLLLLTFRTLVETFRGLRILLVLYSTSRPVVFRAKFDADQSS